MSDFLAQQNIDSLRSHSHGIIDQLFEKYQGDSYMILRLYNYISIQFPHIMENIQKEKEQRIVRKEFLTNEQDIFIQSFLSEYSYFFLPKTEKYFFYDKSHYYSYTEDDVLYKILMAINKERHLLCWKQHTKQRIMTRIRENNLLSSVPESDTIQFVLDHLHPTFFETKAEAKYFLCILGDNLFKKTNTNTNDITDTIIHFIDIKAKKFMQELNNICLVYTGLHLSHSFKYKFYNHEYENCRILKIKEIVKMENVWGQLLSTPSFVLDLICVACHYSIRYQNSDQYLLNSSNDASLIANVFYLKNHTYQSLTEVFLYEYLGIRKREEFHTSDGTMAGIIGAGGPSQLITQITWMDMQYLWRRFLEINHLPMIMFQHTFEDMIKMHLSKFYNESLNCFIGISCKHIPAIKTFIAFWENTITLTDDVILEYEINEICFLYKQWCEQTQQVHKKVVNEKQMLDLIGYFYPEVEVDREKYIYKIKCSLWDKQMDIQGAMDSLKSSMENGNFIRDGSSNVSSIQSPVPNHREVPNQIHTSISGLDLNSCVSLDTYFQSYLTPPRYKISICDAYVYYCKYSVHLYKNNEQIASKTFFEKYFYEISSLYPFVDVS